jgi:hypothetical protein
VCYRSQPLAVNTIYLYGLDLTDEFSGEGAMDNAVTSHEGDEEMLTFDIPDEALERAAGAEQQATTWAHCTHPWYYCPWPQ